MYNLPEDEHLEHVEDTIIKLQLLCKKCAL
jgi:hypothetical protein